MKSILGKNLTMGKIIKTSFKIDQFLALKNPQNEQKT